MQGRMQDKVVVITGGASGIGEGMVRRFCTEGAQVVLADVNAALGQKVATECGARFVPLDVSNETDWKTLEDILRVEYDSLDALLNNAGIVSNQSIVDADVATWNNLIAINLTGMMLGCQVAIKLMRENPGGSGGSIVNTASSTSYLAIPSDVAYTTSKAGVVGLTKSVAVFCATENLNIRVNSIHPGATLTNILKTALEDTPVIQEGLNRMSPMGRLGKVEEVAAMALFLASDEASFCTGGQFPVEGGTVSEHPRMF
ncbi:MAG: 3(or 17)beta-hydroxysteroid dehydrogenase [Halioglobus sp.]|jgi:3(or 17)beta-hydroxysteroid dehydrogenase